LLNNHNHILGTTQRTNKNDTLGPLGHWRCTQDAAYFNTKRSVIDM